MKKEKYCIHCLESAKAIRKERRDIGERTFCYERGTPKGFHKYGYREDFEFGSQRSKE